MSALDTSNNLPNWGITVNGQIPLKRTTNTQIGSANSSFTADADSVKQFLAEIHNAAASQAANNNSTAPTSSSKTTIAERVAKWGLPKTYNEWGVQTIVPKGTNNTNTTATIDTTDTTDTTSSGGTIIDSKPYKELQPAEPMVMDPDLDKNFAIAREVYNGKWGNGRDRYARLTEAGYDYNTIQTYVNDIVANGYKKAYDKYAEVEATLPVDKTYTVNKGDSLWRIAETYGVTVDDLKNWNGITRIFPGDTLSVSGPKSTNSLIAKQQAS